MSDNNSDDEHVRQMSLTEFCNFFSILNKSVFGCHAAR